MTNTYLQKNRVSWEVVIAILWILLQICVLVIEVGWFCERLPMNALNGDESIYISTRNDLSDVPKILKIC